MGVGAEGMEITLYRGQEWGRGPHCVVQKAPEGDDRQTH